LYIQFGLRRVSAFKVISLRLFLKNETRLLDGAWVLVGRKNITCSMFRLMSFSNDLIISKNKYKWRKEWLLRSAAILNFKRSEKHN
jgi:hypothetical protein